LQAKCKADLLSETFSKKYGLAAEEQNDYTRLANHQGQGQRGLKQLHEKDAETILHNLREDSGTGPDGLPARILKNCAVALARPVLLLSMCILTSGVWPQSWRQHWVAPLHKKQSVYKPGNYRGVHLTAQLSKVVERLLKSLYYPYLISSTAFGPSQFAYTTGRGARDALAILALTWLSALATGRKIGVYCSDVSGAFDRVSLERLVAKLRKKGIHPKIVKVLTSWLQQRFAEVVVGGAMSIVMVLMNMVYQGTVTGPILWNLFFEDARFAIHEYFFQEVVYADDLNAYRIFPPDTGNDSIKTCIHNCQQELHKWGLANQVAFDAGKESQHVISVSDPSGNSFKMLGVIFDTSLSMADAIEELVSAASWKLRTLIRTRRFYTHADLVILYKAHLLSFIEYRTPAIYHATRVLIRRVDTIQRRFLNDVGVDEVKALVDFHLAPLSTRRDIAMLGLIHRTALGKGPPQFQEHFRKHAHALTLHDPCTGSRSPLIKRSALGLVAIYNLLPHSFRAVRSVPAFQKSLQEMVTQYATSGHPQWSEVFSPRIPLTSHPLASQYL
jgi:hypothetical protein